MLCDLIRIDSNEFTQYTIFNIKKKISLPYFIPNLQPRDFFLGTKEEFETAMVNEPSVFEPLKFYCTHLERKYISIREYVLS